MVNNAVVVPCAVLGSIAVCMFAFIFWWFPRAWARGNAEDMREYDERRQQREREMDLESVSGETAIGKDIRTPENAASKDTDKSGALKTAFQLSEPQPQSTT